MRRPQMVVFLGTALLLAALSGCGNSREDTPCITVVFLGAALFLGPFLVRRETEKAFLAAAKPKDGRVRVVCLRTAKHWGSSANYKLRCAPVRAAGQGSGGFRKVSRSSSADGR